MSANLRFQWFAYDPGMIHACPDPRLIGPLVSRLSWLRDAVRKGDEAAKKAPLNAQEARTAAPRRPVKELSLALKRIYFGHSQHSRTCRHMSPFLENFVPL